MNILNNTDVVNAVIGIIAIVITAIAGVASIVIVKKHKAKSKIKGDNNIVIQNSEINKR